MMKRILLIGMVVVMATWNTGHGSGFSLPSPTPSPTPAAETTPTETPVVTPTATPFSPTPTPADHCIYVPYHYPGIQLALDAAANGDTIYVAPGEYTGSQNVNLKFRGKTVHLTSFPGETMPVINCEGSDVEPKRAFLFMREDGFGAKVSNICIVNGYHYESGAGIRLLAGSAPVIENVIIENCHSMGFGGGIHAESSGVILNRVRIVGCSSVYGGGGASFQGSHVTLRPIVYRTEFLGNTCQYPQGGGGALTLYWAEPIFTSCEFRDNHETGLLFKSDPESRFEIYNCLFAGNTGGVMVSMGTGIIENSTFSGNTGFALWCDPIRTDVHVLRTCMWGEDDMSLSISSAKYSNMPECAGADMTKCFHANPLFLEGPHGSFYVMQGAGQSVSPNINTGGAPCWMVTFPGPGYPVYLDNMTTSVDHIPDTRFSDIGFHYTLNDQEPTPRPPPERPVIEDILGSTEEFHNNTEMRFLITALVEPPGPDAEIDTVELYWDMFPTPWRLYDDGTHGDLVANDGRYSRMLVFAGMYLPEYWFRMYVVASSTQGDVGIKMPYILAVESGLKPQPPGPVITGRHLWYEPVMPGVDENGYLWILARVEHPLGPDQITDVRLTFEGNDTGLRLLDIGSQADLEKGDGYYGIMILYNGLQIPEPVEVVLEVDACDRDGNVSSTWPVGWKTRSETE
jgi:hypothetical protein